VPDATWYEEMGKAMSRRDKALNAIAKWQQTLAEVEADIEALRTGERVEQETPVAAPAPDAASVADPVALATQ
jgi:hypothetical protein